MTRFTRRGGGADGTPRAASQSFSSCSRVSAEAFPTSARRSTRSAHSASTPPYGRAIGRDSLQSISPISPPGSLNSTMRCDDFQFDEADIVEAEPVGIGLIGRTVRKDFDAQGEVYLGTIIAVDEEANPYLYRCATANRLR
jgi:hypothetical protein